MIDFNDCPLSDRAYGGAAGRKEGIIFMDEPWLIKYPDNLKEKNLENVNESYGNNPVAEFIGSGVYAALGIEVHQTLLGTRNNKPVVACKDFVGNLERLVEFRELKVTYVPHFINSDGDITNGTGMDINEAITCINEHHILSKVPGVKERFWLMFVVDALNGNPDRNNGNWGCIQNLMTREYRLAPVYDNGNCLYFRFSEDKMLEKLQSDASMQQLAVSGLTCRFTENGHRINPFSYMKKHLDNKYLKDAVDYVVRKFTDITLFSILDASEVIPPRYNFYRELYMRRLSALKDIAGGDVLNPDEYTTWSYIPEAVRSNYGITKREQLNTYLKSHQ